MYLHGNTNYFYPSLVVLVQELSFNETITGGTSGATARIRTWDATTNELEIYNITGTFRSGETITGSSSGASHLIRVVDDTNFDMDMVKMMSLNYKQMTF